MFATICGDDLVFDSTPKKYKSNTISNVQNATLNNFNFIGLWQQNHSRQKILTIWTSSILVITPTAISLRSEGVSGQGYKDALNLKENVEKHNNYYFVHKINLFQLFNITQ